MKWLAMIGTALGLVLAAPAALAALAQDLPSVEYEGKRPVTLHYKDLTVTIDAVRGSDANDREPVFKGRFRGRDIFSIKIEEAGAREPIAKARVVWLDRAAAFPQVVLTAFTFGAHCCTEIRIATMTAPNTWTVVDAGKLDGDEGYTFADLGHDGTQELISFDNSFLYAFGSYGDSYAPTRVAKLVGTAIKDVTGDPKYRDFLRGKVREMEESARENPDLWNSNGFLGGWVAAKSLVGEVDDAWARMLKSYDRDSDWLSSQCTSGGSSADCPKDKVDFPQALLQHLIDGEYPTPKEAK